MTVKEHFIPQFYLREFTNKDRKLNVYNCDNQKFLQVKPNNIFFEKHLYETPWIEADEKLGKFVLENDIENIFSDYEGEFAKLLKKISIVCCPTQSEQALILKSSEKELLYRFVINLIVRNPVNMKELCLDFIPDNIRENETVKITYSLFENLGFGSANSLCIAAQKKVSLTDEFEESLPRVCNRSIRSLNFSFYYARELEFITSDMPVCIVDDNSIQEEDKTSIYLALTPKVAVLFGNYKGSDRVRNRLFLIDTEKVDFFNKQIIENHKEKHTIIGRSLDILKRYVVSKEQQPCQNNTQKPIMKIPS